MWKTDHDRRRRRLRRNCGRPICHSFLVMKSKTMILATIIIAILLSTSTIWHVPHVNSISLNALHRSPNILRPILSARARLSTIKSTSALLAVPSSTKGGRPRRYNTNSSRTQSQNTHSTPTVESRWQRAVRIEQRTQFALENLQQRINLQNSINDPGNSDGQLSPTGRNTIIIRRSKTGVRSSVPSGSLIAEQQPQSIVTFPDIRECNSALAAFGDGGDLLRALRLYFKMRKATQLALSSLSSSNASSDETPLVPTPTLVTFSTLMSRAVSLGKPQVALRIWKVMRDQTDFFSYASTAFSTDNNSNSKASNAPTIKASELKNLIVPDVKSANILMNTYAKLGDIEAAEDLMKQMQTKPALSQHDQQQTSPQNIIFGGGIDVPYLKPNLVTYNTLLDACQKTGEIDKALYWKSVLERESNQKEGGRNRATITYKNGKTRSIRLRPDARTYTILIGTVANKKASSSYSYGTHDPSLAFQLLEEMRSKHRIALNPLTYSALIDVCGRCKRSDLALKALRLMLRDERMMKQMEYHAKKNASNSNYDAASMQQQTVGAWTAAINACGKTGRIDTALKLFFVSMPRFKVKPNVITCSCLLDSLLKKGKTADSLEVLRYMKNHNLSPSEYIYTSFMNYAGHLAGLEQSKQRQHRRNDQQSQKLDDQNGGNNRPRPSLSISNNATETTKSAGSNSTSEGDLTKAVDVYSELMSTLITTTERNTPPKRAAEHSKSTPHSQMPTDTTLVTTNNELYQVTLVFREMKASGVTPDLGSYNTLLRSCSKSGDVERAQEFLQEILDSSNDLEPNDRTWRAVLRTAGKAKRSDIVLQTWKSAVTDMGGESEDDGSISKKIGKKSLSSSSKKKRKTNNLSLQTFRTFLMAMLICAWDLRESDKHTCIELYKIIIKCYNALHKGQSLDDLETSELYMGMHLIDSKAATNHPQVLASVLQAVVNLQHLLDPNDAWKDKLKVLGTSIAGTECLGGGYKGDGSASLSYFDKKALQTVRSWTSKQASESQLQ